MDLGFHGLLNSHVHYSYDPANQMTIHNEVKHRCDHLPFLRICTDRDMTISIIHNIRQEHGTPAIYETDGKFGLTLLHIVIGLNTFAGKDNIVACFDANNNNNNNNSSITRLELS